MKTIAIAIISLILASTSFGGPPQVEISARYEGFEFPRYPEFGGAGTSGSGESVLSTPRVTTKAGQQAIIEVIRQTEVPESPSGEKVVSSGVILDVMATVKDGKITLSAKSVLRRELTQEGRESAGTLSFATRETFFNGEIENNKPVTIPVGDGEKDKARIVLTVQLVDSEGQPIK